MADANFFWHGPKLRLYERACLSSFIDAGVTVKLHSFNMDLAVPEGVTLIDAQLVATEAEVVSFTQGGKVGSVAAFTDIFRYRLFKQHPGWWFDTDIFCLQTAASLEAIERTSKGLLIGEQEAGSLNGAALYISNSDIAIELEALANAKGKVFDWGDIGPGLITQYVAAHPDRCTVLPPHYFYPLHYSEADLYFRPDAKSQCVERAADSFCIHLWNEVLGRWNVPQEIMPCPGSYLHDIFSRTGVTVSPDAALPSGTFDFLHYAGQIGPSGRKAVKLVEQARNLKATMLRRPKY